MKARESGACVEMLLFILLQVTHDVIILFVKHKQS